MLVLSITTALAGDAADPKGQLTGKIEYQFVGHLGQVDNEERLLVWEGTIEGDISGKIQWWFVNPSPVSEINFIGGRVTFYAARWEIRVGEKLLLAGDSAGKTVFRDGTDGIWDGYGVVTEASEELKSLMGGKTYETGPVIVGSNPPNSFSGTGMFLIH